MTVKYVIGDLHGNKTIFDHVIDLLEARHDIHGEMWHLHVLGDVGDRGPDGYAIMKRIFQNPEFFTYLRGNHENLLIEAADDFNITPSNIIEELGAIDSISLLWANGGKKTFSDWVHDKDRNKMLDYLRKLPTWISYERYDMCHSGCLQADWEAKRDSDLTWHRAHAHENWFEGRVLIHGHTPIKQISDIIYANQTKVNLDTGAYLTDIIALYNLNQDTIDVITMDTK